MSNPPVWPDSDDDEWPDEIETNVLLGLPDGVVSSTKDLVDPAVSRAGGIPAFLPSITLPPLSIARCKNCNNMMELLLQVWCPLEDSPMDRLIYVWGCARNRCQRQDGSIRAYRCLKYNERFAAKLKRQQKSITVEGTANFVSMPPVNPFSVARVAPPVSNTHLFGSGSLFDQQAPVSEPEGVLDDDPSELLTDEPPATQEEIEELVRALDSTKLDSPLAASWAASPAYVPVYMSSASEFIEAEPKPKIKAYSQVEVEDKATSWSEVYEKSTTDEVFDRFSRKVANEGSQCFRYERSGIPLTFQSDALHHRLFPSTSSSAGGDRSLHRPYDASWVSPCPFCKAQRTFECQLMPNIISSLKRPGDHASGHNTDEKRREELAKLLQQSSNSEGNADQLTGMEWGTCLVYSCANDCRLSDSDHAQEVTQCWREEVVLIQWE